MSKMETLGPLAGGSEGEIKAVGFRSTEYRKRAEAATSLCLAIGNCHRDDAVQIMEAAIADLGAGPPFPPLFSVMQTANEWAAWASDTERKAYAVASYRGLGPADRAAFLAYVGRSAS